MSRKAEIVEVIANGVAIRNWKHVQVNAAMNRAARTFGLATAERRGPGDPTFTATERGRFSEAFSYPPGTVLEIRANGDLLCTGYVNVYSPQFDPKNHEVELEGRSRAQDWIDSSAVHGTGEFQNMTPLAIAKELDKDFKVGVSADIELEPVEYFHIYQGESVDAALERLLRDQFATRFGQPDGSVKLTNASGAKRHSGGIVEGHNILKAAGRLSDMGRFSEVIVKGQRRKGTTPQDLRVRQSFKDRGVRRFRPKVLIHEGDTTPDRASRRATHEAERALGFSMRAMVIVQGWRDDAGQLWTPNQLIYTESAMLKIQGDMLIESVDYHQTGGGYSRGTQAQLSLVHPAAYKGSAGKATKTAAEWGYM